MAQQQYTVSYNIAVNSKGAINSIEKFKEATATLEHLTRRFTAISKSIGQVNAAFASVGKTAPKFDIDTSTATKKLGNVLGLLSRIKTAVAETNALTVGAKGTTIAGSTPLSTTTATADLAKLREKISTTQKAIDGINKRYIHPKANTGTAQNSLDKLLATINAIKENSTITIRAYSSGARANSSSPTATSGSTLVMTGGGQGYMPMAGSMQGQRTTGNASPRGASIVTNGRAADYDYTSGGGGAYRNSGKSGYSYGNAMPPFAPNQSPHKPYSMFSPGHSKYLFPSTRQVIGPTYAGNGTIVGAEFVKGMGMAYGFSALVSGVSSVLHDAMEYENISQSTKNILQVNDESTDFEERFAGLNQLIRNIGIQTRFTAPEVAEAGKFLAMAGYDIKAINEAMRPITNLALIGDTNLGETADVTTNIMTSYGMGNGQMERAADVLTRTSTATNTTLMDLAESFKYAGTVAYQSGLSFEQATAAFGVLGNAGIKASQAGTTIRMMLMNITKPTRGQKHAWELFGINPKDEFGNVRNIIDIFQELNAKRKEMSPGNFAEMFYQMFRITATPGVLALVANADRVKEVTDLNYASGGVAEDLALKKQNTIPGLWHQMTSAFTESGIRGYEGMHAVIRDFLLKLVNVFKSDEFASTMSNLMHAFMDVAGVVGGFVNFISSAIASIPEWFKPWVKSFIIGQMTMNMFIGTLKSIGGVYLGLRGVLLGPVKTALLATVTALKALGAAAWTYIGGRFGRKGVETAAAAASVATGMWEADRTYLSGGFADPRYSAPGFVYAGQETQPAKKPVGLWGNIKNGFGYVKNLIAAHPIEAAVTAATVAIIGFGISMYNSIENARNAAAAVDALHASMDEVGLSKMKLESTDDVVLGNIRAFSNSLWDQNTQLAKSIELWDRYYESTLSKPPVDDGTAFVKTAEGAEYAKIFTKADDVLGKSDKAKEILEKLGINSEILTSSRGGSDLWYSLPDGSAKFWDGYQAGDAVPVRKLLANNGTIDGINETALVQLAFALYGADPNNIHKVNLEELLLRQIPNSYSAADAQQKFDAARKKFLSLPADVAYNSASSETAEEMSKLQVANTTAALGVFKQNVDQIMAPWQNYIKVLESIDKGDAVKEKDLQEVLKLQFGTFFDPRLGIFGTQEWISNAKLLMSENGVFKDANGEIKFANQSSAITNFTTMLDKFMDFFNGLPNNYKAAFLPFAERSAPMAALPDNAKDKMPLGGYSIEGYNEGDKLFFGGGEYVLKRPDKKFEFSRPLWFGVNNGLPFIPQDIRNVPTGNVKNPTDAYVDPMAEDNKNAELDAEIRRAQQQRKREQYLNDGYKSIYNSTSSAPKQVIVRIGNLMNVDKIDLSNPDNVAVIEDVKGQLATALLEVVQDFNSNI